MSENLITILDEIKKLAGEATARPWTAICRDSCKRDDDYAHEGHHLGWEIDEVDQPERGQFVRGYDAALIVALANNAPAILEAARAGVEAERALVRLGNALLDAGPPDDIGPPPEVTEEYYAASDAVHVLARELAQALKENT